MPLGYASLRAVGDFPMKLAPHRLHFYLSIVFAGLAFLIAPKGLAQGSKKELYEWAAKEMKKEEGRRRAMRVAEEEAIAHHVPVGFLDVKWYMSSREVHELRIAAQPLGPDMWKEITAVYGRAATVYYSFSDDVLVVMVVEFREANYEATQKALEADYGPMPKPEKSDKYLLDSQKQIGLFVVQHTQRPRDDVTEEQIQLYMAPANTVKTAASSKVTKPAATPTGKAATAAAAGNGAAPKAAAPTPMSRAAAAAVLAAALSGTPSAATPSAATPSVAKPAVTPTGEVKPATAAWLEQGLRALLLVHELGTKASPENVQNGTQMMVWLNGWIAGERTMSLLSHDYADPPALLQPPDDWYNNEKVAASVLNFFDEYRSDIHPDIPAWLLMVHWYQAAHADTPPRYKETVRQSLKKMAEIANKPER